MMSSPRLLRTLALAIVGAAGLGLQSPGAAALLQGQQPKPAEPRAENTQAAAGIVTACEKGDAFSCRNLAAMYATGRGVTKDEARAATFYERACDLRDMPACNSLGFVYETGRGVTKDDGRAV